MEALEENYREVLNYNINYVSGKGETSAKSMLCGVN